MNSSDKSFRLGEDAYIIRKGIKDNLSKETGWDRVRRMYSMSHYGDISPELTFIVRSGSTNVVIAAVAGAVIEMKNTREDYFRRNVASTFDSDHLARRKLADTMTLNGMKGALKFSLKYGFFSTAYLFTTMTAANYNNKVTVWEHIGTGAILGGVCRMNYGPKGVAAAGCLGGFLGLLAGGTLCLFLHFSGTSMEEFRYYLHEDYYLSRQKKK